MQAKELRSKTTEELTDQLKKMKEGLKNISFDLIQRKEKNFKKAVSARRDIARVLSVINERQILKEANHEQKNI